MQESILQAGGEDSSDLAVDEEVHDHARQVPEDEEHQLPQIRGHPPGDPHEVQAGEAGLRQAVQDQVPVEGHEDKDPQEIAQGGLA